MFLNDIMSVLGGAGQHDVITDFLTGDNVVGLFGGGAQRRGSSSTAGNTTVTLSDNTTIEFLNVSSFTDLEAGSSAANAGFCDATAAASRTRPPYARRHWTGACCANCAR